MRAGKRLFATLNLWMLMGSVGCVAPMDFSDISTSQDKAQHLLRDSIEAHGGKAFTYLRDLSVSYEGTWFNNVDRLQPELVDDSFRKRSEERIIFGADWAIGQLHFGPGGVKQVFRQSGRTTVAYNGKPSSDPVIASASAAVADAYAMFLTGPFYLMETDAKVVMADPTH
ncbi:MAG: hypothetical protein R3236_11315, partial [Phycisphaeraceae bacterium]|nr:hypothetical protein [Phycisphaeraceae bacterium]